MKFSKKFIRANARMCNFEHHEPAPYFRKSFTLQSVPQNAEITICGLGFYELYINGKNITKGPLAPYINNPHDLLYYDNYKVAEYLIPGKNTIGVLLGNGFRNEFGGFVWLFNKAQCRGPVELALCFEAGEGENAVCFEADESFKTHPSPITFNDIHMGCRYNANLEIDGWNLPDFDDSSWQNAERGDTPAGKPRLCEADPVVVTDELRPVSVKFFKESHFCRNGVRPSSEKMPETFRKNVYVFDFGVNIAGVTRLKIKGRKGQIITIRHGEQLTDGEFNEYSTTYNYNDDQRKYYPEYSQTDVYVLKGEGEEEFLPTFKFDGFQYAFLEGLLPEQVNDDTLTALVMNGDLKARADFSCSNETINRLQSMTRRSDLGNFMYYPTDCPHREKNGWTGDASVSAAHILLNLTAEKSLREWLFNVRAAQAENGALPGIVPTGGWGFEGATGPAWDSVCVNVPYYIYKHEGNKDIILENAEMIFRYLSYITEKMDDRGLIAYGLGDWCHPAEPFVGKIPTPLEMTDTGMVLDMAQKAAFLFKEAGLTLQSDFAAALAKTLRNSMRTHLLNKETLAFAGDCITSQAFALNLGLYEPDEVTIGQKRLVEFIHRDGDVTNCGMIGLRHVFHALTAAGETELAFKLITSENPLCYGSFVKAGSSTLWECFHTEKTVIYYSLNHHFFGDISHWFIKVLGGLDPNPNLTDLNEFSVAPQFVSSLDFAKVSYRAKGGDVSVHWHRENGGVTLEISAYDGAHGTIKAPKGYLFESGQTERPLKSGSYTLKKQ